MIKNVALIAERDDVATAAVDMDGEIVKWQPRDPS